jgi:hypothetical protein
MWGKNKMVFYFEIGALLVVILLVVLLVKFVLNPIHVIINSILGIVIFFILNSVFSIGIPITWISVGVVAIGGIPGLLLVLLLHYAGLAF